MVNSNFKYGRKTSLRKHCTGTYIFVYLFYSEFIISSFSFSSASLSDNDIQYPEQNISNNEHAKNDQESSETNQNSTLSCITCNQEFSKRIDLRKHQKLHTNFTCAQCGADFKRITYLRKHMHLHSHSYQPKKYVNIPLDKRTCDMCGKVFELRTSMQKHKRNKHGQLSEVTGCSCPYCEESFANSKIVAKHMQEKHGEYKSIVCNVCGKGFFKQTNLKVHMLLHTGVKKHVCEVRTSC